MEIHTDRSLVAAERPAVRYCTVTSTLEVVARDVSVIIRDSLGAKTVCLNDLPVEMDEDGMHVRLGDVPAGQGVSLVLATQISPKAKGASTSIVLRLADRERVLYGSPTDVSWTAVDAAVDASQPVNREVIVAAARLLAERARGDARELTRVGALDRARQTLARAISRIRAVGDHLREVQAIANTLEDAATS